MEKEAYDLHVLGTPPAFVLSQDQTLIKVRTILRLLSSICLLAYCLLVKNVCCLELNQDALHIWFVLLCSVFKGLLHRKCLSDLFRLPQQLLYHIKATSDCQLFLKVFSISFFEIFQQLIYRNLSFVICQEFF